MKYLLLFLTVSSLVFGAATPEQVIMLLSDDNGVLATFDINQIDPLTHITLKELAEENSKKGLETLLARVPAGADTYICDAFTLNRYLFGRSVPQVPQGDLIDPLSNQVIEDIRYFLLHAPEDRAASTVGSVAGLIKCSHRKTFIAALFFANNEKVTEEGRALASIAIGTHYASGHGVFFKDIKKALYWYEKALQFSNERTKAKANYHIGLLYKHDSDGQNHLQIARSYLNKAIEQSASVGSREYGLLHLAHIEVSEGDLSAALVIFQRLAREATIPEVKYDALEQLKKLEHEDVSSPVVYGLEEKRTDAAVYRSPKPRRVSTLTSAWCQLQKDEKLSAFLNNSSSTSSYEPLEDRNFSTSSNDSSSFSDEP